MKYKVKYKSLPHTLLALKKQVIDGLDFAVNECPQFTDPADLFYWLKRRVAYKNDPKGIELIQSIQTLLTNNWHGVNGFGDCDCFTTSALTLLSANGFKDLFVVLVGRNKYAPVHIYCGLNYNGTFYVLDLTNKEFDQERNYPYKQYLPFKL